jgi:hypothetical protein
MNKRFRVYSARSMEVYAVIEQNSYTHRFQHHPPAKNQANQAETAWSALYPSNELFFEKR